MALYAARNINEAVKNFQDRGYAKVRGIILNHRNVKDENEKVEAFAKENGLSIIGEIPRSDDIILYEEAGKTVIEGNPELDVSRHYIELARTLLTEEESNE